MWWCIVVCRGSLEIILVDRPLNGQKKSLAKDYIDGNTNCNVCNKVPICDHKLHLRQNTYSAQTLFSLNAVIEIIIIQTYTGS